MFGFWKGRKAQPLEKKHNRDVVSPISAESALEKAEDFMDREDYASAITELDKHLSKFPDHAVSYGNRCICYTALENCNSAVSDARRSMALRKRLRPLTYTNLAKILYNEKRYHEALEFVEIALSIDPGYTQAGDIVPMIYSRLGIVSEETGNLNEALEYAKKAYALAPHKESYGRNVNFLKGRISCSLDTTVQLAATMSPSENDFDHPCVCDWCGRRYEYSLSRAYKQGLYCRPKCEEESKVRRGR